VKDEARDPTPPTDPNPGTDPSPETESPPPHRAPEQHRLLGAAPVANALLAILVLTGTGWEWAIKSRADSGIISRSVQAVVTDDTNIVTATAAPPPADSTTPSYKPENILLLGS